MRAFAIIPSILLVAACAHQPPAAVRPVAAVVAAERAFSARAQVVNVRDAFVENFAPDAVAFTPEPGPAFPSLREGPPWGVHIAWRPVDAGASCAGDLGWTTGPADYRRTADGPVFRRGYYSSVWTRGADGTWRVLLDLGAGIPLDAPSEADWSAPTPQPSCAASVASSAADAELGYAMTQLVALSETDAVEAFGRLLHPRARLHRSGAAPALGVDAVRAALFVHPRLRLTQDGMRVASSGDLAYGYGRGAWLDAAGEQRFVYVLVWERVAAGWTLRLIVQDAVRPPPG